MAILQQSKTLHWTAHSRAKMRFYGFSEQRVKRIIHSPKRIEEGIAPKTIAMMQPAGSVKHPYEIWVMIQDMKGKRKIISAWRYPGVTKPRDRISFELLRREYEGYAKTAQESGTATTPHEDIAKRRR